MIDTYHKFETSRNLIESAIPFEIKGGNFQKTILVLGDSTGVGVGAERPSDSVAGLLAKGMRTTYVENHARSGAVVADLFAQINSAKLKEYDIILIQIGGNDIIRFHRAEKVGVLLDHALKQLPPCDQIFVMSAGNVGAATLFPRWLRPLHTAQNRKYHRVFERVCAERGVHYINLYEPPETDPFVLHPNVYLSKDGLHPSSVGYKHWFEKMHPHLP